MKKVSIALLALAGVLFAADPKPAATPTITAELQTAYFQARSDVLEAQLALTTAQAKLDQVVSQMRAVCPTLAVDAQRRPVCGPEPPKPEPIKPQEKK